MKIALLNDTHFGCRNDSPAFLKFQTRFYNDIFFPYLIENDIKTLVHLGDVVDRRKFINHNTANHFKKVFWNKLDELDIDTHIIIGNHDTYFKNTNEVNAMENLSLNRNAKIYKTATEVNFDGLDILFLPWICEANEEESLYAIDNSTSQICMGHLEIKGFEMHKGFYNEYGYDKTLFGRFEKVISGHFHKKSSDGHIYYCGCQYEMTWSDYNCPKGFHIFDTETRDLKRVPNPFQIHKKIIYDDTQTNYDEVKVDDYQDCFVKLFVSQKTNNEMYERFVDRLYNQISVHELVIAEDPTDIQATVREDILEQGEDTMTFLGNYIDQVDTDLDKKKLKDFAKDLYVEASEV